MAAKLVKTGTPGIYRRHAKDCARGARRDCAYVVVQGRQLPPPRQGPRRPTSTPSRPRLTAGVRGRA
jgi:hypothetical protein